jgi:hypothetical protein
LWLAWGGLYFLSRFPWEVPAAIIFVPFQQLGRHKLVIAKRLNWFKRETRRIFGFVNFEIYVARRELCRSVAQTRRGNLSRTRPGLLSGYVAKDIVFANPYDRSLFWVCRTRFD